MNSVRTLLLALLFGAVSLPVFAQVQYTPPSITVTNPLANVHYQYKWEIYGGIGYAHFYGGPQLIEGASLGGPDIQIARFFSKKWGVDANYRGYFGTSPTEPNYYNIRGPFVSEQFAVFGPEYRAFSNKHFSMTFHALGGTAYGDFQRATAPLTTQQVETQLGLYGNQWTPAGVLGAGLDLNRNEHLAFRIEPDATLTHFSNPGVSSGIQTEFALSVGVIYRFIPRYQSPAAKKAAMEKKQQKNEHRRHRSLLHPF